jgi:hypothetical protein
MKSREITNQYRLTQWRQLLSERLAGETIDKFCERKGISRAQFFYWQCKLRKSACTELITQPESSNRQAPCHRAEPTAPELLSTNLPVPNGWAVCEHSENIAGVISIKIGEFQITVDDNFKPELLSKVCKTLVTLC